MDDDVNNVNMKAGAAGRSAHRERYHHGNLRHALIETARLLVEARGALDLSLREVAKQTEVSPASVYRHFTDKSALLAAVAAEGFAELNAAFDRALAARRTLPAGDRLRAIGEAYVGFALEHPNLYRLMFASGRCDTAADPALEREAERAFRSLEAATAGTLAPDVWPSAAAGRAAEAKAVAARAVAAWSLVHGYVLLRLAGRLDCLPTEFLPDTVQVLTALSMDPAAPASTVDRT
jgi:AcrR family transcriptional regulator